jgi:hypothetical protein
VRAGCWKLELYREVLIREELKENESYGTVYFGVKFEPNESGINACFNFTNLPSPVPPYDDDPAPVPVPPPLLVAEADEYSVLLLSFLRSSPSPKASPDA